MAKIVNCYSDVTEALDNVKCTSHPPAPEQGGGYSQENGLCFTFALIVPNYKCGGNIKDLIIHNRQIWQ